MKGAGVMARPHVSFWIIAALGLIWNAMGAINFLMQMSPDTVAGFPDSHRAIIIDRPLWATGGFGVSVFGGALGCALLLLRRAVAVPVLFVAFLGTAVTMVHTVRVGQTLVSFSMAEVVVMIALPLIVLAVLVRFGRSAQRRGWIG
jgi:hypothetical protein